MFQCKEQSDDIWFPHVVDVYIPRTLPKSYYGCKNIPFYMLFTVITRLGSFVWDWEPSWCSFIGFPPCVEVSVKVK